MTGAYPENQGEARDPIDLSEIRRTAEIIDAVAERRVVPASDPSAAGGEPDDPAIRLLQALVNDVDSDAPALHPVTTAARTPARARTSGAAARPSRDRGPRRARRRGAHTLVALSVTVAMFTTTGVAAAGGMIVRAEREEAKPSSGLLTRPRTGPADRTPSREAVGHAEGFFAVTPDPSESDEPKEATPPADDAPGRASHAAEPGKGAPDDQNGDGGKATPTPTPTPGRTPTPKPPAPEDGDADTRHAPSPGPR